MIKYKYLTGAAAFFLASAALAGGFEQVTPNDSGLYLNVNGAYSDVEAGGPGAALGYRFNPHIRIELSANYWRDTYVRTPIFGNSATFQVWPSNTLRLMGNVYYDFDFGGRFVPYLGAGIGTNISWFDRTPPQPGPFFTWYNSAGTDLVAQAIAGIDFKITKKIRLGVSYHLLTSPGFNDVQGFRPNVSNQLAVGLSFYF